MGDAVLSAVLKVREVAALIFVNLYAQHNHRLSTRRLDESWTRLRRNCICLRLRVW